MNPNDRPYIEFDRTLNKGVTKREETKDKDGKVIRGGHPGEFKETWRKHLVSHKPKYDPYCWVTKEWVLGRMQQGMLPVGFGNFDKLPADYPKEWKAKLLEALAVVEGTVNQNKAMLEMQAKLEAENAELKAKNAKQDTESGKSSKSGGVDAGKVEGAVGKAGAAAHV